MSHTPPDTLTTVKKHIVNNEFREAFELLEVLLAAQADEFKLLLQLQGRFAELKRKSLLGIATDDQLQLGYNQLRNDLIDLLFVLKQVPQPQTTPAPSSNRPKQGHILYRIPKTMPVQEETECVVRVAFDEEILREYLDIDEHVVERRIKMAEIMRVEIVDPRNTNFEIRCLNEIQQFTDEDAYTEWLFYVKPLIEGQFDLKLIVSVIEEVRGKERRRQIVLNEKVTIVTGASASDSSFEPLGETINLVGDHEEVALAKDRSIPPQQISPSKKRNFPTRAVAFALTFLIFTSSTTWAFANPAERDWLYTSYLAPSAENFEWYAEEYPLSPHREEAVWQEAKKRDNPATFHKYIDEYPNNKRQEKVAEALDRLETQLVEEVKSTQSKEKILEFLKWYPESEQVEEVVAIALEQAEKEVLGNEEIQPGLIRARDTISNAELLYKYVEANPSEGALQVVAETYLADKLVEEEMDDKPATEVEDKKQSEVIKWIETKTQELVKAKEKQTEKADQALWELVQKQDRKIGYNQYLKRFPEGKYVSEALEGLARLETKGEQSEAKRDQALWELVKEQDTKRGYEEYLQQFPNGKFVDQAKQGIFQLEEQARKKEREKASRQEKRKERWQKRRIFGKDKGEKRSQQETLDRGQTTVGSGQESSLQSKTIDQLITNNQQPDEPKTSPQLAVDSLQDKSQQETEDSGQSETNNQEPEQPTTDNGQLTTALLPDMIFVQGGTYTMGCKDGRDTNCDDDEKPVHEVTLKDFYIGKYEVTNAEFVRFLNANGNQEEGGNTWVNLSNAELEERDGKFTVKSGFEDHPMTGVSWFGAKAYCAWLSKQTGQNHRLPSEAEWEYAARGGQQATDTQFAGSNIIDQVAVYSSDGTAKVGSKQANELGIYDLSGNVYEWCEDSWHDTYTDAPTNGKAWTDGSTSLSVIRGGSWVSIDYDCRVSYRIRYYTDSRISYVGFRVAWY